jgi:hypothetical protein
MITRQAKLGSPIMMSGLAQKVLVEAPTTERDQN